MSIKNEETLAEDPNLSLDSEEQARRKFIKSCAKFAVASPPAITLLLSASRSLAQLPECNSEDQDPHIHLIAREDLCHLVEKRHVLSNECGGLG